ncbi:serine/threonine-protein kinase [Microbulbifer halophilus]|uniref:Protein kinase n=1 Tax=Microbulbifer halophilus TaxID=453963 RepID=A0ABW5EE47_9GAMM|nr:serine/threonine-protein kinase [Microbulbifer halophilus]MCW8125701.1 protein kinase [Microbulbifer halophilus]
MPDTEPQPDPTGRYRIDRQIGAGGMGVVYLAEDTRLHRRVAIKKLRQDVAGSAARRRIRREAQLLASLNHPNIVQLYDVLEEEDGGMALVMEYVEGATLQEWMREQGTAPEDRLSILVQICSALEQAHDLGIVHRDLKPANILINRDGPGLIAKITDFGIAKSWSEHSNLTTAQHTPASWGAVSPEQLQGKPLDHRSDLFALGVLAYGLFCGQNPFGDSDNSFILADRIVRRPHPPASNLNPGLPGELCRLLDRLLAKKPARRPSSAAAVAEELEATDPGAIDRHPPATIASEDFYRRRRTAGKRGIALVSAAALAIAAIAAAFLSGAPPARDARYIAVVPPAAGGPEQSREVRLLTQSVQNAIRQGLSNREGLYLVPQSESRQLHNQSLHRQARAQDAQLLLNPDITCGEKNCELSLELIETESFSTIANRKISLSLDSNLGGFEQTLQQINYLLPQYPPRALSPTLTIGEEDYRRYLELQPRGKTYQNVGETLDALEELQEKAPQFPAIYELYGQLAFDDRFSNRNMDSMDRLEKMLAKAPPEIADTVEILSARLFLFHARYNWEASAEILAKLKSALPDRANYYQAEAIHYHLRGDYERALIASDKALALRTSTNYLLQKALSLSYNGQMEAARPYLQQALEIDDSYIDARSLLAANELDMGRTGETIRLLDTIAPHRLNALDFYNLCMAHYLEKRFPRADRCFTDLYKALPSDVEPLLYRAEIAREQQRPQRARQFSERALELSRQREGWENRLMQALAHAQLGQSERAVASLLKTRQRAPDDTYVNQTLAQIYIATDDLNSAEAHIRRSLELGQSPVWYRTARFAKICSHSAFADLRGEYPTLCTGRGPDGGVARK